MTAPLFGLVLITAAVLAIVWFSFSSRTPTGCEVSRRRFRRGALVETTVPVEGGDLKRSSSPVRSSSCTPSRAREVVEGDAPRPALPSTTCSPLSPMVLLGEEFLGLWDGEDESDWCSPWGIPRPGFLVR